MVEKLFFWLASNWFSDVYIEYMENSTATSTQIPQVEPEKPIVQESMHAKLPLIIGAILLLLVVAGSVGYYFGIQNAVTIDQAQDVRPTITPTETDGVACTLEAQLCPDGSAVGRIGPNCEFEMCPTTETSL